jgi:uncharacterized radical SAM superfamily Fe-S cluster-containing enzyme
MNILKMTRSICPECFKVIDATIFEENGKVYIKKNCIEHGHFQDLYWSDVNEYKRVKKYAIEGDGIQNSHTKIKNGHPFDCGLCPNHKTQTNLAIIDVTNRCNLRCPICFANATAAGYVYEPTKKQIEEMIKNLRAMKPVPAVALQYSGGEPTVREDLPELIKMAVDAGFDHVEVNSNGVKFAESIDYCRKIIEAGGRTIYLQFDGVTPEPYQIIRNSNLLPTKYKAIENLRKAGVDSIVLVPTVVKGVNDDQLGDIIKFAANNFDVVRCVNFQPVSITGRIDNEKRKEMRITIPDCIKLIEEQTEDQVKAADFYPIPVVVPVSQAVGALKGKRYVEFTVHEHCGMATFLLIENGNFVPITRYINVDKFMESMKKVYKTALKGSKKKAQLYLLSASLRHARMGLLKQLIKNVLTEGSYDSLGDLMKNVLMIGLMHFQDPYNFDLERLERCGIHYAVPDGRIIPFCAMNTIYRPQVEKEMSLSIDEWKKRRMFQS